MKQGDFTKLAKYYINRPGYCLEVLKAISKYIRESNDTEFVVADVGAGTGKLTENLWQLGFSGYAVEPNDAMRQEGIQLFETLGRFKWIKGSAEATGLEDSSVDWVLMGSSFHWADTKAALAEFYRIIKPGGFFTAIWNPRDIEKSALEQKIEQYIRSIVPELNRVSSGSKKYTGDLEDKLLSTGHFDNVIFMESPHIEKRSKENYIGAWRSVNDIQAQAGQERFEQIIKMIEEEVKDSPFVEVPYRTRAWTVRSKKT